MDNSAHDWVGPVLYKNEISKAFIEAIVEENPTVNIIDRGSYVRILALNKCILSKKKVEELTGKPLILPRDLEAVMSSFKGQIEIEEERVIWRSYNE